jgi:hypothetical protein
VDWQVLVAGAGPTGAFGSVVLSAEEAFVTYRQEAKTARESLSSRAVEFTGHPPPGCDDEGAPKR